MILLRIGAWLVPRAQRADWLAEWTAERWYVREATNSRTAMVFALGAFKDALWLRRNSSPSSRLLAGIDSPLSCILLLAMAAGASIVPGRAMVQPKPLAHVLIVLIALLILPATMTFSRGEYPARGRLRRCLFLAAKAALVWPIVFSAGSLISRPLQPQMLLAGYVLALRWVFQDQRRRCPICLRWLSHPARIGSASQTFLEWYGTELICVKGHGLLHVPEIPTTSFRRHRWHHLDRSWTTLF